MQAIATRLRRWWPALMPLAAGLIVPALVVRAQSAREAPAPALRGHHLLPAAPAPLPANPVAGTTGTVAPPPEPIGIVPTAADAGIVPARPFTAAIASPVDRTRAVECLTDAIYYEAASEPIDGQRAVAQVVLNRVRHPAFPATVCGVVFQGSEHAGCQFSFACDGAMARRVGATAWARAARVAAAALGGYVFAPVGLATHYHTFAVTPSWNRGMVMTDAVGAHFFHRWQGYWGTAAAFRQAYRGGEPLPGPHGSLPAPVLPVDPVVVAAAAPAPIASPPTPAVSPAPKPTPNDSLPQSPVLDRWKNVGQPLAPPPAL